MRLKRWLAVALCTLGLAGVTTSSFPWSDRMAPQAQAVILNATTINNNGDWGTAADWDCDINTIGDQNCVPDSNYNVAISNTGFTVSGTRTVNKLTINANKDLTFSASTNTSIGSRGNVIIKGTLVMHPNSTKRHTLKFTGMTEANYAGGGDYGDCSGCTANPPQEDVGLWVLNDGKLDAQGTTKVPWNRTCTDTTWSSNDELVEAPIDYGEAVQDDSLFPTVTKGCTPDTVTFGDGETYETTYTAEVLNLTRNVVIQGNSSTQRAHIYIKSRTLQNIKNVEIFYMGPQQSGEGVLGRYALHFHKNGTDQDGLVVENVVVHDAGSHAFAAHDSHGITFEGTIAYNTTDDAYWWDPPTSSYPSAPTPVTDGNIIHNAVAALIHGDPGYRLAGFNLGAGTGNSITDSVAVGVQGNSDSGGFVWPEFGPWGDGEDCDPGAGTVDCTNAFGVWEMDGNISHNNSGMGATVWQVHDTNHKVTDFQAYHNGKAGVFNGAYGNAYSWDGLKLFSNGASSDNTDLGPHTQFFAWMSSLNVVGSPDADRVWSLSNSVLDAGGLTDTAVILAARGVIDAPNADPPNDPGQFIGNTFANYNAEGVEFSFNFHDFGGLCEEGVGICGYETNWFFDDTNVFDGTGPDIHFNGDWLPGQETFLYGVHEDSFIEVEGVGTLYRWDHSSGTLDSACNCKVV